MWQFALKQNRQCGNGLQHRLQWWWGTVAVASLSTHPPLQELGSKSPTSLSARWAYEREADRATHSSIPLRPASFSYSVSMTSMQAGFNAGFHAISTVVEGRKTAVSKAWHLASTLNVLEGDIPPQKGLADCNWLQASKVTRADDGYQKSSCH